MEYCQPPGNSGQKWQSISKIDRWNITRKNERASERERERERKRGGEKKERERGRERQKERNKNVQVGPGSRFKVKVRSSQSVYGHFPGNVKGGKRRKKKKKWRGHEWNYSSRSGSWMPCNPSLVTWGTAEPKYNTRHRQIGVETSESTFIRRCIIEFFVDELKWRWGAAIFNSPVSILIGFFCFHLLAGVSHVHVARRHIPHFTRCNLDDRVHSADTIYSQYEWNSLKEQIARLLSLFNADFDAKMFLTLSVGIDASEGDARTGCQHTCTTGN